MEFCDCGEEATKAGECARCYLVHALAAAINAGKLTFDGAVRLMRDPVGSA